MASQQLALPLPSGDGPPVKRIVLGEGNAHVADALADPSSWPFGTAILAGPPRSGRSLFARWFADSGAGSALDDADCMDETALFHRWNRAQEAGEPLLLTVAEGVWDIALPDLRSRMGAALGLTIDAPGDALVVALMEDHAAQRGLALGEGATRYCLPRMVRDYAAIERLVAEIDRLSLQRKQPAGRTIWRDALELVTGPEAARLL